jgi:flagellar hook-associated protein 1
MSLASLLSIARSALLAQQRAMDVTGHNIANASTTGYSRQRLTLTASTPLWTALGPVGRGVDAGAVVRIRDSYLDDAFRRESGSLGGSTTMRSFLSQVEGAIGEPSETGVGAAIDGLFTAFADLAADPSNASSREAARQAGSRLVARVKQLDGRIAQAQADALTRLNSEVTEINSMTRRIAELNASILATGGASGSSPDLQDARDLIVDQLSSMTGVTVVRHDDGSIGVLAGDTLLVDGGAAQELAVRSSGTGYGVGLASGTALMDPRGGSLGALCDLTSDTLPGLRRQLDTMVAGLVDQVNTVHRTGYTLAGGTGTDFFSAAGTTAATFSLSSAVAASGDAIAAAGTDADGDGSVALRLSMLGSTPVAALGNRSVREFYTQFVTSVGEAVSDAQAGVDTSQTLVDNADSQRTSVSGVSLDEEMVALIAQQQAYGAAARLVTMANEIAQQVIDLVG